MDVSGIKAFKDFVGYDSTWGWVRAGSEIWVWWGTEQNLGLGGYWADGSKIWVSLDIGETGSKLWVWPQLGMANHTDARVDTDLGLFLSHWHVASMQVTWWDGETLFLLCWVQTHSCAHKAR